MRVTCIVAITDGETVYIGGDRGHSNNDVIVSSLAPKVFNKSHYLIGFAGNTGIGQSIAYTFDAPTHRVNTDTYKYVYQFFIPALREHLKDQLSDKEDNQTSFILGIKGKLFEIDTGDFQCTEYAEVAIGSGSSYAYGSLHTTQQFPAATPEMRVTWALNAATTYSPTCQEPIDILYL
jgi:ATP-dependent protease HslVU (ClpYQ) peptidase subunit